MSGRVRFRGGKEKAGWTLPGNLDLADVTEVPQLPAQLHFRFRQDVRLETLDARLVSCWCNAVKIQLKLEPYIWKKYKHNIMNASSLRAWLLFEILNNNNILIEFTSHPPDLSTHLHCVA